MMTDYILFLKYKIIYVTFVCRDLQLPMQLSVTIAVTTNIVSSIPVHGKVYSMQLYVIESLSVTCGRSVIFSTNTTDRHDKTEILLNHRIPIQLTVTIKLKYC